MKQRCYFHKNQYIDHFCSLKQCTLPLCQQCMQIHEEQHNEKDQLPQIISYQQAYDEVYRNLNGFVQHNQKEKQKIQSSIKKDKERVIKIIEEYFGQFQAMVQKQSMLLQEVEQKLQKLKKGSIKTVIYYYSGDIKLNDLNFPEFKEISFSIEKILKDIQNEKKQEIQTFRVQSSEQIQSQNQSKISVQEQKVPNSRKKSIFSNEKGTGSHHKNRNDPYLDVNPILKQENLQKTKYPVYQIQKTLASGQRSQVYNYIHNENNYKAPLSPGKNVSNEPIQRYQYAEKYQILRETPSVINIQAKQLRSKTLDKFPSMRELRHERQNLHVRFANQQDLIAKNSNEVKVGQWNKCKFDQKQLNSYQGQLSRFSQTSQLTQKYKINSEFQNRKPLKTTDLETYVPPVQKYEYRERAASYEQGGLRTTVSHNNLHSAKKQPLLGDNLKKQVLSPQQIRKMLEKKIQERNKMLNQKKEYNLKLNSDRANITSKNIANTASKENILIQDPSATNYGQQRVNFIPKTYEQPTVGYQNSYNTRQSIINQIYRETKY